MLKPSVRKSSIKTAWHRSVHFIAELVCADKVIFSVFGNFHTSHISIQDAKSLKNCGFPSFLNAALPIEILLQTSFEF